MRYKVGDIVQGKVISIKSYGAFISLDKDTTGLLHISEISHEYVKEVTSVLNLKDEIDIKILAIDNEKHQMIFSMKALSKSKRKTKYRARNTRNESIMETKKGFDDLEMMLPYWINSFDGGRNV